LFFDKSSRTEGKGVRGVIYSSMRGKKRRITSQSLDQEEKGKKGGGGNLRKKKLPRESGSGSKRKPSRGT